MRRRFMSDRHVVYNQADYLSFEALEDGFMLSFPQELRYSVNGGVWKSLPSNVSTKPINSGDIISLQGDCERSTYNGIGIFNLYKKCNVFGNILSITGYKILRSWQFYNLFKNGTIVDGSNLILPATTLADNCYDSMFSGCTSLVNAPELPATTLADYCYNYMFQGCTSLVNAPELPATTLANYCYKNMLQGCTSLVNAPVLPATTLAYYCYNYMFQGCTSLVNAPELPATTLADYCYNYMFQGCTSLVNAPELPATTLANSCYDTMFSGCTSLVNAPELPATTLANYCYNYMFSGCTSLVNAPELPAATLDYMCYYHMFSNCTNLNYIKMLATDISAHQCLDNWVSGISPTGTFVKSKDATWDVVGDSGVPTGWTVITDEEESGGGKITNNIILSYAGSGSFLRKLAVEMDYPAASDLIIQRSSDEGITWADLPPILAGTSNFTSTVYHIAGHIYRLKTAEDDTYVYTFTVEER